MHGSDQEFGGQPLKLMKRICFSHGQESGPWGTKIRAMADTAGELGWSAESLDYQGMDDPLARVDKLVGWCREQPGACVLAGSSMGGYVALAAAARVGARGLFLLAPALYVPGYEEYMPASPACPTTIVHGWRDDVVPYQGSLRYGSESRARVLMVDGGHRLTEHIDTICSVLRMFLAELDQAVTGANSRP